MIKKVLVANRGEIALRIMRTVKEMSLDAVVIYDIKMNTIDSVMYSPSWGGQNTAS